MVVPKVVLLDLDDTLLDHMHASTATLASVYQQFPAFQVLSLPQITELHDRLLEEIHVDVACGRMSLQKGRELRYQRMLCRCGVEEARSAQLAIEIAAAARRIYLASRRLVPGARELLAGLRGRAVIGVVTNNTVDEQNEKLRTFDLAGSIDFMVVSEEIGVAKPDPRIFHEALRRAGCGADQAVMLGDSWSSDVMAAKAAGIRAVWLNRAGKPMPAAFDVRELRSLEATADVMGALGIDGLAT